ncbi:MAG: protein-L-isoaspartate(D-aspartate) O-methyltransferase [Bacteroidetes bacterium]|nr:protein-L-isoaspartate(D-aspartate) O-methyltransferase [Bacteroidota bacterium]MDA1019158.1 protein-L-isoaspartate(D-aspartate) O-methyltransferase [Bacteroidota bacterium]
MLDTSKHKGLRKRLVEELIKKGIDSRMVLNAILNIPRHLFIDNDFEAHAYIDKAFPIDSNQTISQPYTVAFQTTILGIEKNDKVLEIGTGSGYQTAVLVKLNANVYTIERQHLLYRKSMKRLNFLGYSPKLVKYGDGYLGLPEHAPFDKILVTAGASKIPKKLLLQLKIGGKIIIPIGELNQEMTLIIRKSETKFEKKKLGKFNFVPMLKKTN